MSSSTSSSASRRRKCLPKLYHSAKAGCLTMDEEMLQDLGIVIHSSGGEVCNVIFTLTSSPSSDDVTSVFWESDDIACHFRDYMDQFTNTYGRSKFLEWSYVHHLSTHSNSKGCSSLITSGLEIATIAVTHTGPPNHHDECRSS
jgi:hypothetical protein